MAEIDGHEAQVYQLRAVLRGISPLIWRRLLLRSDSTVAQLHEASQIAFGWEDEHLKRFEIRGREYAVHREGGGMIGIDARDVRLCDTFFACRTVSRNRCVTAPFVFDFLVRTRSAPFPGRNKWR